MPRRLDGNDTVARFHSRTLAYREWAHEAHLVVGLWYLLTCGDPWTTLCYLKPQLIEFNRALGIENTETSGYHETITVFWLLRLEEFVRREKSTDFDELVRKLLRKRSFFQKTFMQQWYPYDVANSVRDRAVYVAPP